MNPQDTDHSSSPPAIHSVLLEGKAPTHVHLLPSGVFSGQDGRGPYHVDDMDDVIQSSKSETGLVIDYDHQTDYAARPGVGVAAPAAGWIRDIEKRDDGIWGYVEWTPKASHAIEEGEYRYLSPVFLHDDDGKILRILRAGLTNNPNLSLKALTSDEKRREKEPSTHAIAQSLNLADGNSDSSVQAILDAIEGLKAQTTAARDAYHQLLQISGTTDADKKEDPNWIALQEKLTHRLTETTAHSACLEERVATIEKKTLENLSHRLIGDAISTGQIAPALRSWAIAYHHRDAEGFEQFLKGQPVLMTQHSIVPTELPKRSTSSALSDIDTSICTQLDLDPKRFSQARAQFRKRHGTEFSPPPTPEGEPSS